MLLGKKIALYSAFVTYISLFVVIGARTDLTRGDQASMTTTFATISGVLLGLYSAVKKGDQPFQTIFLLASILVSLASSMVSLNTSNMPLIPSLASADYDPVRSAKGLFLISMALFAFTTMMFGISMNQALMSKPRTGRPVS